MTKQGQVWNFTACESQSIATARGRIEYVDVGQGLPVLYFHGTGAGNDAAVMMEGALLEEGFRLIVPNRPGYFGTPISSGNASRDCADHAQELLDHLGIERAAVIGTSGGGPPAISFATRHSSRVAALVLQCAQSHTWDSSRWMPQGLGWTYFMFRHHRFCMPLLRMGMRRETDKLRRNPHSLLKTMSGKREPEIRGDEAACTLVPHLAAAELRCAEQPRGIENDWTILVEESWLVPGLLRCSTLILHDTADPLVPFRHAEWARQSIPGAVLVKLYAGGHLIWVGKDAERMRAERREFIRRGFH